MTKLSKESEKAVKEFDTFDQNVKELTLDQMNMSPIKDVEPQSDQLMISQKQKEKMSDIYLKPDRTIGCSEKFNEKYRKDFEFSKEMVCFEAENIEIIGENIEVWTKPFAGVPAQFWKIPVNVPVYGPRYLAEQLTKCRYHRLKMQENEISGGDGRGTYLGKMVANETIHRLNARPATSRKSIFMGAI